MWCTRWYLPLLLLPFPTAPPYMLVLFIFSLTIDARPCFYCIILLSSLFLSSCYWQPIPIESHLTRPWSENITTFGDALNMTLQPIIPLSSSVQVPLPPVLRPVDRCWCEFTSGNFFEPLNVTEWERTSVEKVKKEMESQGKLAKALKEAQENNGTDNDPRASSSQATKPNRLLSIFRSIYRTADKSQRPADLFSPPEPSPSEVAQQEEQIQEQTEIPWLWRKEYDLREHGIDLIVDFGWSRES